MCFGFHIAERCSWSGNDVCWIKYSQYQNQLYPVILSGVELYQIHNNLQSFLMAWQHRQINFQCEKTEKGSIQMRSTIIFRNIACNSYKFKSEALRENGLDRLISMVVDETGNNVEFDQLSIKQTIHYLRQNMSDEFKNNQIHLQDGLMKIILKQKIRPKKNMPGQEPTSLVNDKLFQPFLNRFKKLLTFLTPYLEKCSKLSGKQGLIGCKKTQTLSYNKDKKRKQCELRLSKALYKILKGRKKNQDENTRNSSSKDQNEIDEQYYRCEIKEDKSQQVTGTFEEVSNFYEIEEIKLNQKSLKNDTGGACQVQKRKAKIKYKQNSTTIRQNNKILAVKKPRVHLEQKKQEQFEQRFKRQIKILQHLNKSGKKTYLLNYYLEKTEQNVLYMDYYDLNLNQFLYYYRQFLSTQELFSICKQIMEIVEDLHKNGVVHRDLKPSNFLVDLSQNIRLKLIDFSDSWFMGDCSMEKLCGTVPYSPLESSKNCKKYEKEGINKPQIDYWSVGILLHEVFFTGLPLSYSPCMGKDIHSLWFSQFLYTCNFRQERGLKLIKSGFEMLNLSLVRVKPQERMDLRTAYKVLCELEIFHRDLLQLVLND